MSGDRPGAGAELSAAERRELLAKLLRARAARKSLSFAQERLWFLHQMVPDSPVYNVPAAVRLEGDLDTGALERGLREIISRHDVLRTRFERRETGPVPVVDESIEFALERVEIRDVDNGDREAEALARANLEARQTFDLERGPLVRGLLLGLGARDHLLVLTFHHSIAEGWSVALLFRELEAIYAAFRDGAPSPLEPLPIQYGDFARWQRERGKGEMAEREFDYWRRQLSGELPVLELPADRPRPPVQTFAGAWKARPLPAALIDRLSELASANGATLFMVLLAAFQTLLHRYSGVTDVLVGSPIAVRNRAEAEQLIGVFINTLVMRADLSGDPRFETLVEQVRDTAVGAFSNQEMPFERIVEEIQPERNTSHTPIFQVMLAMQNTPLPTLELAGLERARVLDPSQVHNGTTKLDLAMFIDQTPEGLEAACEYSTDLFDESTIERLLGHFQTLLEGIAADPEQRLSRLPILDEGERHRLLHEWNDTAEDYPTTPVHQLFEERAAERPEGLAVVCADRSLSYADLDREGNRLARYLRDNGVHREARVALAASPSTDAILGMVAAAKAGACYVPLDPAHPAQRLAYLLADAGAEILLTQEHLLDQLPETSARIVCFDRDHDIWSRMSDEPLGLECRTDQLAYVIYTSGSTGEPKGVEVEQRGLANLAAWHRETYRVAPGDRTTQLAGLGFDASVWEIWPTLSAGATLYVVEEETRISPDAVIEFLTDNQIHVSFIPTPLAELVLEREVPRDMALRDLLTGGAQLHRYRPAGVPYRLINHYGPTENSVVSTAGVVETREDAQSLPPIGRPIDNHRVYILDGNLEPTPIGVPGEIYVGGAGLARGYAGRPEQTAERFIPDPFSDDDARLYATGDVARYLSDGRIEFLGRRDGQVKVRGYRIELGEIEANLRDHADVDEAVVVVRQDHGLQAYLAAYVTTTGGAALPAEELRGFLRRSLPDYMIPATYNALPRMPLTPNGKIDRDALPDPASDVDPDVDPASQKATHGASDPTAERIPSGAPAGESPTRPAGTPLDLEETITGLWSDLLRTDDIGLDDNFFEMGGHSMMLVEVHSRLSEIVDARITVVDLFRYPTISALVSFLESRLSVAQESVERDA